MKQTAVEWLEYNLKDNLGKIVINQNWQLLEDLIKQSKKMEKEQIIDAFNSYPIIVMDAEQYYNETFKSE
jgi:adenylate kinase